MPTSVELPIVRPTAPAAPVHDAGWLRAARTARLLSWFSLAYMGVEGGVGIWQGVVAGSIALVGWSLASFIEGLASVVVVWRFTGSRMRSATAEARAQRLVAAQFFVLAPYVAIESVRTLVMGAHAEVTAIGIALTATSVVLMPLLGVAKRRLALRLDSGATAGEGTQNILCAMQAGAVLLGLVANALVGAWWLDPLMGLFVAFVALKEGREAWRGESTCADGCC
jgi:divalent metal cation (Fe/Co/Zn/Cd) transporter